MPVAMFKNLSRKQRWSITALCIANSIVGIGIGWGLRYIHPPTDMSELQKQCWDKAALYEPVIDLLLKSELWKKSNQQIGGSETYEIPEEFWTTIEFSLRLVKAEVIIRESEGIQLSLPKFR